MKITRDVILDLLPLYIANELSEDTRALVDDYLETDPEIAKIALKTVVPGLMSEVPVPLTKDNKMEAYSETKRIMFQRLVIIAVVLTFLGAFITLAVMFITPSI